MSPSDNPDFGSIILSRRMVRSFLGEAVPPDVLDRLIGFALSAPSAGNTSSLQLLVLVGESTKSYWDTTLPDERRPDFPWPGLLNAPALIVPYVEPTAYPSRYSEPDKAHTGLGAGPDAWPVPYWWVDGGAAAQNLLLGAVAVGLGACLFGQFEHEPAVRERFGVPEAMRAVGTVAVGYENVEDRRPSSSSGRKRPPRSEAVHWNSW